MADLDVLAPEADVRQTPHIEVTKELPNLPVLGCGLRDSCLMFRDSALRFRAFRDLGFTCKARDEGFF